MKKLNILVVDDEKNIRRSMQMILSSEGHQVDLAEDAEAAVNSIQGAIPDLIFLDVKLPGKDGLTLLDEIKKQRPGIEIVMISGHADLSMAVEATRKGAYDFLEKPLQKEKILLTIRHLLENRGLKEEFKRLQEERLDEYRMIGKSPALNRIREQIQKVAPTNSKVLITGESGTGKELVAWAIHNYSSRSENPFIKMNCAAIPEELTESELFGHEKGAFTGASEQRDGKFLQADSGTLFLDEIADMSLKTQTKVLRVLQDGQFQRVGGKTTISVDVRVIAATNKDLSRLVQEGGFREDLFYRLNVFPIQVPALRERREDIPRLLEYFIQKYCLQNNRRPVRLESSALSLLKKYNWPGNVRELKNLVERMLILNPGHELTADDLPQQVKSPEFKSSSIAPGSRTLKEVRENAEREYIRHCLRECQGNVSQAAEMLGMERTNLHKKMKSLGLDR